MSGKEPLSTVLTVQTNNRLTFTNIVAKMINRKSCERVK